ncbi:MAG: hypothetical protein PHO49_03125 [Candidatus Nanoarchaeia archaeon]|nr:hypothetical protein [Candidatus Nanoarchaeia archaeon]
MSLPRLTCLIASLLIISSFICLAEDIDNATEEGTITDYTVANAWLLNSMKNASWNKPIPELTFSLLAINNFGEYNSEVKQGILKLLNKSSVRGCFPKTSCKVKDTALALLALGKTGQDINKTATWLKNMEIASGATAGSWIIQFTSSVDGTCQITCEGSTVAKPVEVGPTKPWINADSLCGPIGNKKFKKYDIDCVNVGDQSLRVTLLYHIVRPGFTEDYLLHDEQTQKTTLTIENACFAIASGVGTCDYESTLYATWALKAIAGEEVNTLPYLEENKDTNALHRSLLYLVTPESDYYSNWLKEHQKSSGSWLDDVYITSIGAIAMIQSPDDADSYINATKWLTLKYNNKKHNWNDKILDTASALIALSGGFKESSITLSEEDIEEVTNEETGGNATLSIETVCNDNIDNDNDTFVDCYDNDCSNDNACLCNDYSVECGPNLACETGTCDFRTCTCGTTTITEPTGECSLSAGDACEEGSCDVGYECSAGCSCELSTDITEECTSSDDCITDYDCDDGYECIGCDCIEKETTTTTEEGSIWPWIIIIIIAIILLMFLAYYYLNYVKKGKTFKDFTGDLGAKFGKKKKPSFEEYLSTRPRPSAELIRPKQMPARQLPAFSTQAAPKKSAREKSVDDELEKSLAEAKKLLGK